MTSKRPQFINGEIYHIFNRGVEKRNIFQEIADYFRFIYCLYECNDKNFVVMRDRMDERKKRKSIGTTYGNFQRRKREFMVEILAFCLMPNHYHLVVRQLTDNGISLFMKKLGDSYVGYFNRKHNRKGMGSLFQGKFKAVYIETTAQFMNLICYVFTNPTELIEKNWKKEEIKDTKKALKFVESYRWSNYLDCIGKDNFPSVTQREFILEVFGDTLNIKKNVEDWILYKAELNKGLGAIKDLCLE